MRKILSLLFAAILICSMSAVAFAEGFNANIDVVDNGEYITVIIPTENEEILNRLTPTLTIPCDYDFPQVEWDGTAVGGVKTDGTAVRFPLEHAGSYTISRESLTQETADLVLPNDLTEIRSQAFQGVEATSIYIPDGCRMIGAEAFAGSEAQFVRIPESAVEIDPTAFPGGTVIYGVDGGIISAFASNNGFAFVPE